MQRRRDFLVAVLALSLLAVVWSVFFKSDNEQVSFKDFIGSITALISALGVAKESGAKKPSRKTRAPKATPPIIEKPFRLSPSFESGLYGGLIGGAIAGMIIGVVYCVRSQEPIALGAPAGLDIIPQIFIYASLTGTLLGASTQPTIQWFRYAVVERQYSALVLNEVSGGILGGTVGGILAGALGGWFFGLRETPPVNIELLVGGAALGAVCIVLGALMYDYKGRWRNVMRALLVSTVIAFFVAALGIFVLQALGISDRFFFSWTTIGIAIRGGGILGLGVGIVLGLQIGLTLLLHRLWTVISEPMER